ncbi:biotin--[acetyl-CoA-carboxylase] ligase [Antrihabitans cavernicola]|uniref:biotin--[biotin carboxyl-carrier protein] ligase n=1 Tax=Antrihabitans cavernicola TaxID=2495913 RepID=A0A5A7SBV6_9NOCA|nr:biotin--[acetyl-CoA-carboxylase] ligase [Spelaeibacter cavernicola]KAA0022632.1 biotin--[acetyl-CoA-carboxylase] ligase [Spelaeibacter cavernicola]
MFSDLSRPPLNAAELRRGLEYFSALDVVDSTGSTNADLLARAGDRDADRSVLIAEFQETGRGRHSRTWISPPQAQISMSVLLRLPGIPPADLGWLPLLTGIAAVDALRAAAKVDAKLKWPNDVQIDGKKVAGILAEVGETAPEPVVVIGIGLNVSLREDELPAPEATSLLLAGADITDRTTLVRALLRELAARLTAWERVGWSTADLAAVYRERCSTIGASVRADLPGGEAVTGTATDVDAQGRLSIDTGAGVRSVSAGDVTHLRPA